MKGPFTIDLTFSLVENPSPGQMVQSLARESGPLKPHFAAGPWEPRYAGCTPPGELTSSKSGHSNILRLRPRYSLSSPP